MNIKLHKSFKSIVDKLNTIHPNTFKLIKDDTEGGCSIVFEDHILNRHAKKSINEQARIPSLEYIMLFYISKNILHLYKRYDNYTIVLSSQIDPIIRHAIMSEHSTRQLTDFDKIFNYDIPANKIINVIEKPEFFNIIKLYTEFILNIIHKLDDFLDNINNDLLTAKNDINVEHTLLNI